MASQPQFEVIDNDQPPATEDSSEAIDLFLALLSDKSAAIATGFYSLLTVISVFWLALAIIPHDPSTYQLTGLCGYAIFVIAVNIIARRK
ncbi:MAG TPA: hypothetical protein VMS08_02845 [Candidatus Saccharimonadia bacterium]|nr:hypothetical protein [Candidatus Saccharimonadia bacterium]